MIKVVFATSTLQPNGEYAFGNKGKLPWPHIPRDFRNFKARTADSAIVMGRKTFESLPGHLPGRFNMVISSDVNNVPVAANGDLPDHVMSPSDLEKTCRDLEKQFGNVCVIGGKGLILDAFRFADQVIHTVIECGHVEFDVGFTKQQLISKISGTRIDLESNWARIEKNNVHYICETVYGAKE
ncbi:dihydrofolate reductase [Serratia phage 4S]|nr:dihydrofolate reductase [Serratia phage 4S]